jgi:hypothetical protein
MQQLQDPFSSTAWSDASLLTDLFLQRVAGKAKGTEKEVVRPTGLEPVTF